jgi:hypothetical protein
MPGFPALRCVHTRQGVGTRFSTKWQEFQR